MDKNYSSSKTGIQEIIKEEYSKVIDVFTKGLNLDKEALLERMLQITKISQQGNCHRSAPPQRIVLQPYLLGGEAAHELIHALASRRIEGKKVIHSDNPLAYAVGSYFYAKKWGGSEFPKANDDDFAMFKRISKRNSYLKYIKLLKVIHETHFGHIGLKVGQYAYEFEKKHKKDYLGLNFLYFFSLSLDKKEARKCSLN